MTTLFFNEIFNWAAYTYTYIHKVVLVVQMVFFVCHFIFRKPFWAEKFLSKNQKPNSGLKADSIQFSRGFLLIQEKSVNKNKKNGEHSSKLHFQFSLLVQQMQQ